MTSTTSIRILAKGNNERGDLFTRVTRDLFFTLGYDQLELNVALSGREIDIQGKHRSEPRRLIAECKAHTDPIGGSDLNKFLGILTRERRRYDPQQLSGYFVSMSGFTGTAIQQETESGDNGIILLGAARVIEELQRGRVIVALAEAAERAGQCAQANALTAAQFDTAEFIVYEGGYAWALYYAHGKERTHFTLIHADGTPLAASIAKEIIEADRDVGGLLHTLTYLAPAPPPPSASSQKQSALARYKSWLAEDCGYIQLDGLPADAELSATRLKLEKLFVPLRAQLSPDSDDSNTDPIKNTSSEVFPIAELVGRYPQLALLAAPGGGKSTLLKSLAIAYAFPERRLGISKDLPDCDWMPLLLRCRELRERAHRPMLELLGDLCAHAGMSEPELASFRLALHDALTTGNTLILIDGLDEISDEGARITFTRHLRTLLAMFPKVRLVVTSREAGFRIVASVVAGACVRAKLAPLEQSEVRDLCIRWHIEVFGDSSKVREDAISLANAIWKEGRIRALADNPLLLTTLLVVRRWIGELPRSRAALYREAVRVLIRTWNVEGYEPLDEEETLAQLSYLACSMVQQGTSQIAHKPLLKNLQGARRELEAELQFARISTEQFVQRIEYRSSLLMQVGHTLIDDELQPVYEFRHLTFQEYLAARGFVEEQYPGRDSGQTLADLLSPHFDDARWREVISLAAVLGGRKAEETVKRLVAACQFASRRNELTPGGRNPLAALRNCLLDEVQVTGPTLKLALRQVAMEPYGIADDLLIEGKFGAVLREVVETDYLGGKDNWDAFYSSFNEIFVGPTRFTTPINAKSATDVLSDLEGSERFPRICAAFRCVNFAFESADATTGMLDTPNQKLLTVQEHSERARLFEPLRRGLLKMLDHADEPVALPAAWALAWIGEAKLFTKPPSPDDVLLIFWLWRQAKSSELRRFAAWSFTTQPLLSRDTFRLQQWGDCDEFLQSAILNQYKSSIRDAALVVSWYRRAPLDDTALLNELDKIDLKSQPTRVLRDLLKTLGPAGAQVLGRWDAAEAERRSKEETPA